MNDTNSTQLLHEFTTLTEHLMLYMPQKTLKYVSFEFLTRLILFLNLSLFHILAPRRSVCGSTFGVIMIM
jgi:hypothetical protein